VIGEMKSLISILFSVFYLTLSFGVSINVHLCTNKMAPSEISDCSKNGCCGDGEKQSCCTEITYVLHLDNSEQICVNNQDPQNTFASPHTHLISCFNPLVIKKVKLPLFELQEANQSTPLYTLYCSRIHYA